MVRLGRGKDNVLSVRAPGGIALDQARIVGPRQGLEGARLAVVDTQNPLDGEEQLREIQVGLGDKDRPVFDGADHEAAVRRDLGKQSERVVSLLPLIVAPSDDRAPVQGHRAADSYKGVGALIVRIVDVHPQHAPVGGERMAIAAHGQVLQHNRRGLRGRDRSEPPPNRGRVLNRFHKRQVHFPVKQRRFHLVRRGLDGHMPSGQDLRQRSLMDSGNSHEGRLRNRPAFDLLPNCRFRPPFGLLGKAIDARPAVGELDRDQPQVRLGIVILPPKARCADVERKEGLVQWVLNGHTIWWCGPSQALQHLLRIRPGGPKAENRHTDSDNHRRPGPHQEISHGLSHRFLTPKDITDRGRPGPLQSESFL